MDGSPSPSYVTGFQKKKQYTLSNKHHLSSLLFSVFCGVLASLSHPNPIAQSARRFRSSHHLLPAPLQHASIAFHDCPELPGTAATSVVGALFIHCGFEDIRAALFIYLFDIIDVRSTSDMHILYVDSLNLIPQHSSQLDNVVAFALDIIDGHSTSQYE
jgi:hypothetical protein